MTKSYKELMTLDTYESRLKYLQTHNKVGYDTFGNLRLLNQALYKSYEWKKIRTKVILRDKGCDLGCPDRPIFGKIYIHHINPITADDILKRNPIIFNMDNLISVSMETHNAIHYGDESVIHKYDVVERYPGDTCPWKKGKQNGH